MGLKKIIYVFLPAILFLSFIDDHALAANLPFLNKSKIRVNVPAGKQIFGDIIVENPTSDIRTMRLYLEDWYYVASGDGTKEFMPADTSTKSCASWINFSPAEFTLAPFGRQIVSYSVKAPQTAQGGYYAALFFETDVGNLSQAVKEQGAGINLTVRIASLFYVEVEGTVKRTGVLGNLRVENERTNGNKLAIELDFENTGNVDITAGGTFHILDKKGIVYARGEFEKAYTFPKDKVKLGAKWPESLAEGVYDLILTIDFGKALEESGLGRGPVVTKEARIEIGSGGTVTRVSDLR